MLHNHGNDGNKITCACKFGTVLSSACPDDSVFTELDSSNNGFLLEGIPPGTVPAAGLLASGQLLSLSAASVLTLVENCQLNTGVDLMIFQLEVENAPIVNITLLDKNGQQVSPTQVSGWFSPQSGKSTEIFLNYFTKNWKLHY